MQKSDISASEGQEVASMTLKVLKSIRSDDMFKLFWDRFVKRLNILVFHHQVYHVVVKLLEDLKKEMQRVCFLKHQRTTTDLSTLKYWISSPLLLLIDLIGLVIMFFTMFKILF